VPADRDPEAVRTFATFTPEAVAAVRTVLRHKASLVQMASSHVQHIHKALTECGRDLSAFPTVADFASRLGLCPDNRITGGKVLSTRTRKVNHPLATALRLAAQALHRSRSALGSTLRLPP
jgi:transposase